jgi:tetratricopeptide (TPR) repeat protein
MKIIPLLIACSALASAGGWYYGMAAPEQRFRAALRALRANDAEEVQYQLLTVEPCAQLEGQASLLRGWLLLHSKKGDDPGRTSAILEELNDAALDDENDRALALALLGRARYESGQLADALVLLDRAAQLNPDEVEAHRLAGVIFYDLGLPGAVIPHLEEVARLEPFNGRPHRLLGLIHHERGATLGDAFAFQAAVEAYQESLKRDPNQADAHEIRVELGRCLVYRNEWDEALAALRPCFDSADALAVRAECYHAKGDIDRAMQCVDLALEQYPESANALSVKAMLAIAKRDVRQAVELLERAVKEKSRDYNLRYRLVQAYRHLGEQELADRHTEDMDKLLELSEEEKVLIRKSISNPDAAIRYRLADLATQLDQSQLAKSWLKAANLLDSPVLQRMLTPAPVTPAKP